MKKRVPGSLGFILLTMLSGSAMAADLSTRAPLHSRAPMMAPGYNWIVVYRHSDHVINLFVAQGAQAEQGARVETMQGFNVELWSEKGLNLCAVGDVSAEELQDFRKKFEAAAWSGPI
jgi:hypothetical protein